MGQIMIKPLADAERDCFRARAGVQLGQDLSHVEFHRVLADAEFPRDGLVRRAVGQHAQDFEFARGKRGRRLRGGLGNSGGNERFQVAADRSPPCPRRRLGSRRGFRRPLHREAARRARRGGVRRRSTAASPSRTIAGAGSSSSSGTAASTTSE